MGAYFPSALFLPLRYSCSRSATLPTGEDAGQAPAGGGHGGRFLSQALVKRPAAVSALLSCSEAWASSAVGRDQHVWDALAQTQREERTLAAPAAASCRMCKSFTGRQRPQESPAVSDLRP